MRIENNKINDATKEGSIMLYPEDEDGNPEGEEGDPEDEEGNPEANVGELTDLEMNTESNGFIYDDYGNKTPMTNAHIHNLTRLKIVTVSNFDDIY